MIRVFPGVVVYKYNIIYPQCSVKTEAEVELLDLGGQMSFEFPHRARACQQQHRPILTYLFVFVFVFGIARSGRANKSHTERKPVPTTWQQQPPGPPEIPGTTNDLNIGVGGQVGLCLIVESYQFLTNSKIMMMVMNVVMKTCEGLGDHRRRHVMGREGHLADPHHQHHHSCTDFVNFCICTTTPCCTFVHFCTFASAGGRCADISKFLLIICVHLSSLYTF